MMSVNKKGQKLPWAVPAQPGGNGKRAADNHDFYNSTPWRKTSTAWRTAHPVCEVSMSDGHELPAEVTDHIIRIEDGGAKWDPANFMAMSHYWHNVKRAHESRHGVLVATKKNEDGHLVPADRRDIIDFLLKNTP